MTNLTYLSNYFTVTGHSHGGGGGHGHGHSHGGHGHSHNSDSHNSDSHEEESCSDAHSHEPYELTNLKDAKQTSNGVLANVVVESDDEGDKTDDELQGNGHESTPGKPKLGKCLLSQHCHILSNAEFVCLMCVSTVGTMFPTLKRPHPIC